VSVSVDRRAGGAIPEVAPLVEVYRGEVVESRHRGAIAVVDSAGRLTHAAGDPRLRTFWRSSSKPLQALPVVATGAADHYRLGPWHLAIMCGSHVGQDYHVAVVADILERAGIPESALRCDLAGRPLLRHGCSGKHAGMLVTAKFLGEPIDDYTAPDHPGQRRIRQTLALLADIPESEIAVASDGCSVPTFAMTLEQMARAFARLVDPAELPPSLRDACARIVAAMGAHPELLSGAEGETQDLTSALVGLAPLALVAKSGAESLYCVGVAPGLVGPRGVGIALRAEDGGHVQRSCYLPTIAALCQLGVLDASQVARLEPYLARVVRNVHGQVVGEVRPVFHLSSRETP
jgi:L-asparaginase II